MINPTSKYGKKYITKEQSAQLRAYRFDLRIDTHILIRMSDPDDTGMSHAWYYADTRRGRKPKISLVGLPSLIKGE
jgi:hypothetical protein